MTTQIPIDYTKTIGDFTSIYDSTNPPTDTASLPPVSNDMVIPIEKTFTGPLSTPDGPAQHNEGTYNITAEDLKRWLFQGIGTIKEWQAETEYFPAYIDTNTGLIYPPDIVTFQGDVFVTVQQHISGLDFHERPGDIVFERLTKDSDKVYNEITASMVELFDVGQIIGQYTCNRPFRVYMEYSFPNERLGYPENYHRVQVNSTIAAPIVVNIQRRNRYLGITTIGTITFTPEVTTDHCIDGIIAFNDSNSGINATTELYFEDGDTLLFTMGQIDNSLEWISLNLLAEIINLRSPYFNVAV